MPMAAQMDMAQTAFGTAPSRILVVDDEPRIRSFIGRALDAAGYEPSFAGTGAHGLRRALDGKFALIILDLVMPDMDGRELLDAILGVNPDQPVMVLSCVADVAAKVDCLERGAQDYLTKPFSLAELLARVRVQVRHRGDARTEQRAETHGEVIRVGQVSLDVGRLSADVGHGPVPLTRLEFLLLRELAEHAGHSVAKGKLLASVWGYDFDPGSNVVDVCVRRLRSKLGFDLIKTVRGEGYQLVDGLPAALARWCVGALLGGERDCHRGLAMLAGDPLLPHLDHLYRPVRVQGLADQADHVGARRGYRHHRGGQRDRCTERFRADRRAVRGSPDGGGVPGHGVARAP
jgi:DNA-binding response OmpR family regulator